MPGYSSIACRSLSRDKLIASRVSPLRSTPVPRRRLATATLSPSEADHLEPETFGETAHSQVGYIYFDSLYPIKLGFWDLRSFFVRTDHKVLLERLKSKLPDEASIGHGFHAIGAEERLKDGGAFLSFAYTPAHSPPPNAGKFETRDEALLHIEQKLKDGLRRGDNILERALLSWGTTPSVHVVRGRPWLEDLNRFPALRLRVGFTGGQLSEETLWGILRPYGRIASIDVKSGEAFVLFSRMRSATAARNCAHGLTLPDGTRLLITYAGLERAKKLWDWLTNHPRIVLPILAFLLGGFTYAVFDPIRAFFIESKLSHTFQLDNYRLIAWLKKNTVDLLIDNGASKHSDDTVDWFERRAARESIQDWLKEKPETFITIAGPRGSGKHKLLEAAIPKNAKTLTIDCAEIAKSVGGTSSTSASKTPGSDANGNGKTDAALVSALASQVGYWPVFGWLNSLNSMIDLAAVGLIGSKAGFSRPVEEQLSQVLEVTTQALNSTAIKETKKAEQQRQRLERAARKDGHVHTREANGAPSDRMAQPEKPKDGVARTLGDAQRSASGTTPADSSADQKATSVEDAPVKIQAQAPVVIIDNFHLKSLRSPMLYSVLTSWASSLVSSGTVHVIFVSDNPVAMSKEIGRALPDSQPANNIVLADAEPERAREFVRSRLREARQSSSSTAQSQAHTGCTPGEEATAGAEAAEGDVGCSSSGSSTLAAVLKGPQQFLGLTGSSETNEAKVRTSSEAGSALQAGPTLSNSADDEVLPERDAAWVDKLGGRLTDLENLLAKISIGQSVPNAVSDIVSRTTVELRKSFFGDDSAESSTLPWTRSNAWAVILLLTESENGSVPYHWILHSDSGAFKGDEAKLRAMEEAELLSVRHKDGRPSTVRAGRPVLLEAMRDLVAQDDTFRLTQEYLDAKSSLSKTEASVRSLQDELRSLVELAKLKSVANRMDVLAKKLDGEQDKAAKLEDKVGRIEKELKSLE
ncbi:unnamed protein product [Parajaminaea phylloscopi]